MTHALKVRPIGNSVGVILPKEVLRALNVREGDILYLADAQPGFRVVAHDPDFESIMAAYEGVARRYRNALRELAK